MSSIERESNLISRQPLLLHLHLRLTLLCICAFVQVVIERAEKGCYLAKIDGKVLVRLGLQKSEDLTVANPDGWELAAKGRGYAVWERL